MSVPKDGAQKGVPVGHTLRSLWVNDGNWVPRVLVAEDDDELRYLIKHTLQREGFRVIEARDGLELLEQAAQICEDDGAPPEVLLTDVRMPGCTGIEALSILRDCLPGTAILVLTAFSDEDLKRAAGEVGAVGVMDKPFDLGALRDAVTALLR